MPPPASPLGRHEASSSGSSQRTATPQRQASEEKGSEYELTSFNNLENGASPETSDRQPLTRAGRIALRYPKLYRILFRAYTYLKGPRPKFDLPDPVPFLDINRHIFGRRISLPIESTWIKSTRFFQSWWLFCILVAAYIISLAFLARANSFLTPKDSYIGCTATWWLANAQCGLNGDSCGPFDNTTVYDFRCPGQCSNVILQNPRTIGNSEMAFVPLVVGGGGVNQTYRGDSFICAAAIQAGVITNSKGGCGSFRLVTDYTGYEGTFANGLRSISFPTIFPVGFQFSDSTSLTHCTDLRDGALAFNVLVTCVIMFLLRPKPIVAFWSLLCIGFWHISLFSQPSGSPPALSTAFAQFLPTLFIGYAIWRLAFRFVLPGFIRNAPLEGGIWYLGPFWVSVLSNSTFEKIPIGRLTARDIGQRAGGITAFVIILVVLVIVAINQVRVMRKTGWLFQYIGWYVAGGLVLLVLGLLPTLQLHIHHYIISLALMPATAFNTRLSAIYQGLLLGLFLNGAAAFGLDSILETAEELRQDATLGSDLPTFLTNFSTWDSSIPLVNQTLSWLSPPEGWDGFSLLIDDVERLSGYALNYSLSALNASIPHFFRLALTSNGQVGDFTKAATLWANGTWVDPLPGPSY